MFFIGNPSNLEVYIWQPFKMTVKSLTSAILLRLVCLYFQLLV